MLHVEEGGGERVRYCRDDDGADDAVRLSTILFY